LPGEHDTHLCGGGKRRCNAFDLGNQAAASGVTRRPAGGNPWRYRRRCRIHIFRERAREDDHLHSCTFLAEGHESGHVRTEAKAEQVAPLVVWLCTDAAANVNGRTLYVGGEEVGLWSEPELIRCATRPGGWGLDSLEGPGANYFTFGLIEELLFEI
jgi:hypothetical protein